MGEVGEHQGNPDEGVPPRMQFRVDDAAVALAADHRAGLAHRGHHIDLADGAGRVGLAMALGHIAQSPGGAEVADDRTRGVGEDVVGHCHEGVLFAEHGPVLVDEGESVHIRIYGDAEVAAVLDDRAGQGGQVLRARLGVVGEPAVGFAIEFDDLVHAEGLEERRDGDATGAVDGVHRDLEAGLGNGLAVDEVEVEDGLDVGVNPAVVGGHSAEAITEA